MSESHNDFFEVMKHAASQQDGTVGHPKYGTVQSVNANQMEVRVQVEPEGTLSGWLPWPTLSAVGVQVVCPPAQGTQVTLDCMHGDVESLSITGVIFSAVDQPPTSPATNQPVQQGEFGIFLGQGVFLHMTPGGSTLGGNLHVTGNINSDQIITGKDVRTIDGKKLESHTHPYNNSFTGAPTTS